VAIDWNEATLGNRLGAGSFGAVVPLSMGAIDLGCVKRSIQTGRLASIARVDLKREIDILQMVTTVNHS
jgi:hypothetical protein